MIFALGFGQALTDLQPALLCGGEGMVAVADGVQQPATVFGQLINGGKHAFRISVLHCPAAQMAAAEHQIEVVQAAQFIATRVQWFDYRAAGIVDEHHHMR